MKIGAIFVLRILLEWMFVILGLGLLFFGGQFIVRAAAGYLP